MKKKVLQVLGGIGFGGAEAFVMNQYRNMRNEYTFDFAVQVHFDKKNSYEREIKKLGGSIYYTGLFRTSPIGYAENIKKIINEHGPYSAVHIHVNEQCGFAALGAKKAGVKHIIVHAHSSQYGQKNLVVKKLMLAANRVLVNKYADTVVACSTEAAKMYFGRRGLLRAIILKNPIDIKHFFYVSVNDTLKKSLGAESGIVITHIGRFIEAKNHEFILKICNQLKSRKIDYTMLLVGNGARRDYIESLVNQQGLSDNVIFLGERADIPEILSVSNVFILPSKYEGLPTVVLEAQASGTPSIVSSTVNKESDIGIGLVQFVDIRDNNSDIIWADKIINHPEKIRNYETINHAFSARDINLDKVSGILRQCYN